ncbi:hypothetical protein SARC_06176 [Sphaeroforma arctica JP610]|uniref:Uncharacterized protein n=1 Tax=Sphaeroforma arctica JP610 TaxID=667725 RepID=A0A0L0FXE0_9EUKA|nr:hypothetical protein SARC_06176 [Sphaeroforma arctica JP610]KNC81510.1 hypothetical protein SARC_06176 [Sphaeroforma arctica JP610]|eukprot:XP_014155412.1 hypothetical protein SARC_06176 [Sphaeroforma arctica JP610]
MSASHVREQLYNGGLAPGTQKTYRSALTVWNMFAAQHNLTTFVPTTTQLTCFLEYCFFEGILPDQVKKIWAAATSLFRSSGYISLWNQYHSATLPDLPKIIVPWAVSLLVAHGIEEQWRALIATLWLMGARRHTNKTFEPESLVFEASTHTLIVDLHTKKRGDRSQVSKIITRILDPLTFEFMSLPLLDAVDPRSTFTLSPATVLNALNDDDSILMVHDYFIRAGLSRETARRYEHWHVFRRGLAQSAFSLRVPDDLIAGLLSIDIASLKSYQSVVTPTRLQIIA